MILGRGTAEGDEAILAEYHHFLQDPRHRYSHGTLEGFRGAAVAIYRRMGKPIRSWSEQDILALYQDRQSATRHVYNAFFAFLFFRGYCRATIRLFEELQGDFSRYWTPFTEHYRQKIAQTAQEFGYTPNNNSHVFTLLVWMLSVIGKPLEELTREDFDPFRDAYQNQYRPRRKGGRVDSQLSRLERYLVHWGNLSLSHEVLRYDELVEKLEHPTIRSAILLYLYWSETKYQRSTTNSIRAALVAFFLWLQQQYPASSRLDDVTRAVALEYGHYLHQQVQAKRFGLAHQRGIVNLTKLLKQTAEKYGILAVWVQKLLGPSTKAIASLLKSSATVSGSTTASLSATVTSKSSWPSKASC